MYGLPVDTDVSFLRGSSLLQVCVGENETILNLHSRISIMIASSVSVVPPGGSESTFEEPRQLGPALLPILGSTVTDVSIVPPGTLRLTWSSGHVVDIVDSWKEFESYTVTTDDKVIVV
jgi:Family of unknown function (DUF6188)